MVVSTRGSFRGSWPSSRLSCTSACCFASLINEILMVFTIGCVRIVALPCGYPNNPSTPKADRRGTSYWALPSTRNRRAILQSMCSHFSYPSITDQIVDRDDVLMRANNDVTAALRRTMDLMQGELEKSVLSTQILGILSFISLFTRAKVSL
jgi:hypothetical protein